MSKEGLDGYKDDCNGLIEVAAVALTLQAYGKQYLLMSERINPKGSFKYTMPGGARKLGESMDETGARELLEETNLQVMPSDLTSIGDPVVVDSTWNIQFFSCVVDIAAPWQRIIN